MLITLRTLNVSEHNGFLDGVATGSAGLGMSMDFVSTFRFASGYHRRAVALAERHKSPGLAYLAYLCMAWHKAFQGELDQALAYGRRSAEAFWETGNLHRWGFSTYQIALILAYRGAYSRALAHCGDLIRFGQEGADSQVECWGLAAQGFVQQRLGQFDEAIAALREALELAEEIADLTWCISTSADLGRCYLGQGNLAQALAALDRSLAFYTPYLGGDSYASLRNGLADAYLFAAEQRGQAEKADWLKKARRACKDARKQGQAFRPGLPEAMRLQGTYEFLRGKPAAAQRWWQHSLARAEEMGQRYDVGMTHLEVGLRLGEHSHLQRAEAILAELGIGPSRAVRRTP